MIIINDLEENKWTDLLNDLIKVFEKYNIRLWGIDEDDHRSIFYYEVIEEIKNE